MKNSILSITAFMLIGFIGKCHSLSLCNVVGDLTQDSRSPSLEWEEDNRYMVLPLSSKSEKSYIIRGDIITLNEKSFPSLYTLANSTISNAGKIQIDARKIIVDMPLRFSGGIIRLTASTVLFTGRGSISFTEPPIKKSQAIEIVANTLDFTNAPFTPFAFRTTGDYIPQESIDDPNGVLSKVKWPNEKTGTRNIKISAVNFLQPRKWSFKDWTSATYDHLRLSSSSSGLTMPDLKYYDILMGDAALEDYNSSLISEVGWPEYSVDKLRRIYSLAPYTKETRDFTKKMYDSLYSKIVNRTNKSALSRLIDLNLKMSEMKDLYGLTREEVVFNDIGKVFNDFESEVKDLFGDNSVVSAENPTGFIATLDNSIIKNFNEKRQNSDLISDYKTQFNALERDMLNTRSKINDIIENIAAKNQETEIIRDKYIKRMKTVQDEWEKEKKKKEKAGQVVKTIKQIALGVSTLYPPSIPYVAGAITAYDAISAYNCPLNKGKKGLELFTMIAEDASKQWNEYNSISKNIQNEWKILRDNSDAALDYVTSSKNSEKDKIAFEKFMSAQKKYASNLQALKKQSENNTCNDQISLPDFIEKDDEIMNLQAQLLSLKKQLEALQKDLLSNQQSYIDMNSKRSQTAIGLKNLQSIDINDELSRLRILEFALRERNRRLDKLNRLSYITRRSIAFMTGVDPIKEGQSNGGTFSYDTVLDNMISIEINDKKSFESWNIDGISKSLENDYSIRRLYYNAISDIYKNKISFNNLKSGTQAQDTYTASIDSSSDADVKFIQAVNAEIESNILFPNRNLIKPLIIPYRRKDINYPEYLIGVSFKSVWDKNYPLPNGAKNQVVEFEVESGDLAFTNQSNTLCTYAKRADGYSQTIFRNGGYITKNRNSPYDAWHKIYVKVPSPQAWQAGSKISPKLKSLTINFTKVGYDN